MSNETNNDANLESIFADVFKETPGGTEFKQTPADEYIGKVVGVGINTNVEREYQGEKSIVTQAKVIFAVKVTDGDTTREDLVFSKGYKFSLHEKAGFMKLLQVLFKDKSITKASLEAKYGKKLLNALIGLEACLDITHKTVDTKTYVNIEEITRARNTDDSGVGEVEINKKLAAKYNLFIGKVKSDLPNDNELPIESTIKNDKVESDFVKEDDAEDDLFDNGEDIFSDME